MDPISVASALYSIYNMFHKPKVKTISYDDALSQAQAAINPSYAANLQRSISALNSNAASRGVAGQDRTQNQVAAQVSASEAQRSANVASAAQAIMNGQNAQNLATYQAENAQNQNQTNSLLNALSSLSKMYTNNGAQSLTTQPGGYQWVQGSASNGSNKYDMNHMEKYFQYQKVN